MGIYVRLTQGLTPLCTPFLVRLSHGVGEGGVGGHGGFGGALREGVICKGDRPSQSHPCHFFYGPLQGEGEEEHSDGFALPHAPHMSADLLIPAQNTIFYLPRRYRYHVVFQIFVL
jgi:hypothetical protein